MCVCLTSHRNYPGRHRGWINVNDDGGLVARCVCSLWDRCVCVCSLWDRFVCVLYETNVCVLCETGLFVCVLRATGVCVSSETHLWVCVSVCSLCEKACDWDLFLWVWSVCCVSVCALACVYMCACVRHLLTGRFSLCCSAAFFFHRRSLSSLTLLSMAATSRFRLFRLSLCCCSLEFWSWFSLLRSCTENTEHTGDGKQEGWRTRVRGWRVYWRLSSSLRSTGFEPQCPQTVL